MSGIITRVQRSIASSNGLIRAKDELINTPLLSSLISNRSFATDDGTEPPASPPEAAVESPAEPSPASTEAAAAPAEDKPTTAAAQSDDNQPQTMNDLIERGFTKRQAAWLAPDPEKHKHFLPKLARKELGSFLDPITATEFANETNLYPVVPDVPLYNLRDVVPEMVEPQNPLFDQFVQLKAQYPNESFIELAERLGMQIPDEPLAPYPGARKILQWQGRLTLNVGVNEEHPADSKVKCRVHLSELGEEKGISIKGLERIAEICGTRYDVKTGILMLTSDKYSDREDNRRDIVEMLNGLIEEGIKYDAKHGSSSSSSSKAKA